MNRFQPKTRSTPIQAPPGAANSITNIVLVLVAGFLAQMVQWRAPFALYLSALPVLATACFTVPAGLKTRRSPKSDLAPLASLWPIYLTLMAVFVAVFMTSIQLSLLLASRGVSQPGARSVFLSLVSLASALAGYNFGAMSKKFGRRRTFACMLGFLGLGLTLIGLANSAWLTGLGCVIAGFGAGLCSPHFTALLLSRAAQAVRGKAVGLMYTAVFASDFLNPVTLTPIKAQMGISGLYIMIGTMLTALALYAVSRVRTFSKSGLTAWE